MLFENEVVTGHREELAVRSVQPEVFQYAWRRVDDGFADEEEEVLDPAETDLLHRFDQPPAARREVGFAGPRRGPAAGAGGWTALGEGQLVLRFVTDGWFTSVASVRPFHGRALATHPGRPTTARLEPAHPTPGGRDSLGTVR